MQKIIKIVLISMLFFLLWGCSSSEDSRVQEFNTTKLIEKIEIQKVEDTLLQEMGFDFIDDKIIIDLNRSSSFFSNMEKKMEEKAKEIENRINDINLTTDAGVVVTDEQVNIDLNRTKNILDNFSSLFEDIILDINSSIN